MRYEFDSDQDQWHENECKTIEMVNDEVVDVSMDDALNERHVSSDAGTEMLKEQHIEQKVQKMKMQKQEAARIELEEVKKAESYKDERSREQMAIVAGDGSL